MYLALILTIIVIIIILITIIITEARDLYSYNNSKLVGGNGKIHYKGRGSPDESIDQLLNRIYWVADADGRTSKWHRAFFISILATCLIVLVIFHRIPTPREIILLILIIFVSSLAVFGFFRFHSDRFAPYYIRQNINFARQKLNLPAKYTDPGIPSTFSSTPPYNQLPSLLS